VITNEWIPLSEKKPTKCGAYLVLAETADPDSPLFFMAWYEPEGTRNPPGWSLMHPNFIPSITYWMKPERPSAPAPCFCPHCGIQHTYKGHAS
jgi:hypothetical protein